MLLFALRLSKFFSSCSLIVVHYIHNLGFQDGEQNSEIGQESTLCFCRNVLCCLEKLTFKFFWFFLSKKKGQEDKVKK
jgi:hypothetical protein